MTPAKQLSHLRTRLSAMFGSHGERVLAQPLAELETQLEAPDPAVVGPLIDRVEDLVEALMLDSGWQEGGGA